MNETLEEARKIRDFYLTISDEFPKTALPGRTELLNILIERGIPFGVVTSTNKSNLLMDLSLVGIDAEKYAYLQGADESEFHKPDPRVFNSIIEDLTLKGIKAEEILYVGDGIYDMEAARAAHIGFVGIPNGVTTNLNSFLEAGALAFENIDEFIEFIRENTEASNEIDFK